MKLAQLDPKESTAYHCFRSGLVPDAAVLPICPKADCRRDSLAGPDRRSSSRIWLALARLRFRASIYCRRHCDPPVCDNSSRSVRIRRCTTCVAGPPSCWRIRPATLRIASATDAGVGPAFCPAAGGGAWAAFGSGANSSRSIASFAFGASRFGVLAGVSSTGGRGVFAVKDRHLSRRRFCRAFHRPGGRAGPDASASSISAKRFCRRPSTW